MTNVQRWLWKYFISVASPTFSLTWFGFEFGFRFGFGFVFGFRFGLVFGLGLAPPFAHLPRRATASTQYDLHLLTHSPHPTSPPTPHHHPTSPHPTHQPPTGRPHEALRFELGKYGLVGA